MNILSSGNTHGWSCFSTTAPVEAHYLKSTTSQRSQVWRKLGECLERVEVICELFVFFLFVYMDSIHVYGTYIW